MDSISLPVFILVLSTISLWSYHREQDRETRWLILCPGYSVTASAGAPDITRLLPAHRSNGILEPIDADLQLSGHTHGGQLFFLQWLISTYNGGLVNGLYERGGRTLYVCPGTGLWAGFSCRLGVPAELTRVIFRPQP